MLTDIAYSKLSSKLIKIVKIVSVQWFARGLLIVGMECALQCITAQNFTFTVRPAGRGSSALAAKLQVISL